MKKEEIDTINIQLISLIIVLLSTIISIILTYNQKLNLEENEGLLSPEKSLKLTLYNRLLAVIISFVFLYVNYKLYEISKEEGENLKSYSLQIIASFLAVISSLIALYVVSLSTTESLSDVENPII